MTIDPTRSQRMQRAVIPVAAWNVFVMGDSSGGCLSLQLVQLIRDLGLSEPAGVVLLSPFIDHEHRNSTYHTNWNTDFFNLDLAGFKWLTRMYANGLDPSHPGFVDEMMLILVQQVGDSEVFTNDSVVLFQVISEYGGESQLQLYETMFHVFHFFPFIPESTEAFRRIEKFVKTRLNELDGRYDEIATWVIKNRVPAHRFIEMIRMTRLQYLRVRSQQLITLDPNQNVNVNVNVNVDDDDDSTEVDTQDTLSAIEELPINVAVAHKIAIRNNCIFESQLFIHEL
eukprot:jgi/Hompol1/1068/HPOL_001172-RA